MRAFDESINMGILTLFKFEPFETKSFFCAYFFDKQFLKKELMNKINESEKWSVVRCQLNGRIDASWWYQFSSQN